MSTLTSLLVGAFHRPPAKQVIAVLPAGCPLILEEDFGNPWDEGNAIKVLVAPSAIPESQHQILALTLMGTGTEIDELLAGAPIQLGFVAAAKNKSLVATSYVSNLAFGEALGGEANLENWNSAPIGKLGFTPEGKPTVSLDSGWEATRLDQLAEEEELARNSER